jgi:hypothetical protein
MATQREGRNEADHTMACQKMSHRLGSIRATGPQPQIYVFRRTARRRCIAVFPSARSTLAPTSTAANSKARHINQIKPMTATAVIPEQSPFAVPKHIPALFLRPMTGERVSTTALADPKEVTP